jgi:hypothetical protein
MNILCCAIIVQIVRIHVVLAQYKVRPLAHLAKVCMLIARADAVGEPLHTFNR